MTLCSMTITVLFNMCDLFKDTILLSCRAQSQYACLLDISSSSQLSYSWINIVAASVSAWWSNIAFRFHHLRRTLVCVSRCRCRSRPNRLKYCVLIGLVIRDILPCLSCLQSWNEIKASSHSIFFSFCKCTWCCSLSIVYKEWDSGINVFFRKFILKRSTTPCISICVPSCVPRFVGLCLPVSVRFHLSLSICCVRIWNRLSDVLGKLIERSEKDKIWKRTVMISCYVK